MALENVSITSSSHIRTDWPHELLSYITYILCPNHGSEKAPDNGTGLLSMPFRSLEALYKLSVPIQPIFCQEYSRSAFKRIFKTDHCLLHKKLHCIRSQGN